jgi:hypothetical protein
MHPHAPTPVESASLSLAHASGLRCVNHKTQHTFLAKVLELAPQLWRVPRLASTRRDVTRHLVGGGAWRGYACTRFASRRAS